MQSLDENRLLKHYYINIILCFKGMSFTNTSPCVAPIRARKAIIGTNPIAVAAPGNNGDSFELDMATSTVAFGKVIDLNIPFYYFLI